jgi:hypothetical protein
MSELYEQIVSGRGKVETWMERIPGFKGYADNKARREADRMLREHIAGQLVSRINRFVAAERRLLDGGGLSWMSKTATMKGKLQHYRDRINTAAAGYSGFFAPIKLTPEKMEEIYAFDEAQVRYLDRFDTAIKAFDEAVTAKAGIDEALAVLDALTLEANEAFSLRDDVLTNLNKTLG